MAISKSLYGISQDMLSLDRLLDELEGDVSGQEEVIDAWFEENADNLDQKADGYIYYIEELQDRAETLKRKKKQLNKTKNLLESRAERLKDRLQDVLEYHSLEEVGSNRRAKLRGSGGKRPVDVKVSPEQLPEALQNKKVRIKADKSAILEATGGEPGEVVIDGEIVATVNERGNYVHFE